jgi:hypothetical protein
MTKIMFAFDGGQRTAYKIKAPLLYKTKKLKP